MSYFFTVDTRFDLRDHSYILVLKKSMSIDCLFSIYLYCETYINHGISRIKYKINTLGKSLVMGLTLFTSILTHYMLHKIKSFFNCLERI